MDVKSAKSGMELSREYFFNIAEPSLRREFPELYPRLAAGLAGNGSECFGYDDSLSRDHDWGADFFIWTTESDAGLIPALRSWKSALLRASPPPFPRERSEYGAHIGVMTCGEFYTSLTGVPECPKTLNEWLRVPEDNFALAVNGDVFMDGAGDFTKTRTRLLEYFPEDLRRKRISAKCMALAQTGQYNLDRTAKRNDIVTLQSVLSRFTDGSLAMVFLLNRVYKPYYKWAFRAARDLPVLGAETSRLLLRIARSRFTAGDSGAVPPAGPHDGSPAGSLAECKECIAELCALFASELRAQGLSETEDWFLTTHAEEVRRGIGDEFLRSLPAQLEI